MSGKGFIKLYRKITEHEFYLEDRKFSKFEAWIDLIMMANHKDHRFMLGNQFVDVKKGQIITSERKLMERWKWGKEKVRAYLKLLENDGMIVKESDRQKTTLTLCNYSVYHDYETETRPQTDHKQTTNRPQTDLIKKEKNVKNDKKDIKKTSRHKFETCDMEAALLLKNLILDNNPNARVPELPEAWAQESRLMRERDKRTMQQIIYLINWSQNNTFWRDTILSMAKLRKNFDVLAAKAKSEHERKKQEKGKSESGKIEAARELAKQNGLSF
jgi:hypothetical protein